MFDELPNQSSYGWIGWIYFYDPVFTLPYLQHIKNEILTN